MPSEAARARLIELLAEDLLARPIVELVPPRAIAEAIRAIAGAAAASDAAVERVLKPVVDLVDELHDEQERLGQLLPHDVVATLRELAMHHYAPDRRVAEKLLSSDPVRHALREALAAALDATTQRSPVGGLVGFGKKMAEQAMKSSGALGAMIESKGGELVDAALAALLERVVDIVCDPKRARDQAALRRALLDSAMALRGRDLAREIHRAQPQKLAQIVRKHVAAWAARPESVEEAEGLIVRLLGDDLSRPAGEVARELGVEAPVRAALRSNLERTVGRFLAGDAFARWLAEHGKGG